MPTIETLSERPKPVAPTTLGCEVLARFEREPDTLVIPVVDGNRPVGLVERTAFLQKIAARFGHALYDLRPITFAMDPRAGGGRGRCSHRRLLRHHAEGRPGRLAARLHRHA